MSRKNERPELAQNNEKRMRFRGEFVRFGEKSGWRQPEKTILMKNVRFAHDDELAADHLWFNLTKGFAKLNLLEGDIVEFDARVKQYE